MMIGIILIYLMVGVVVTLTLFLVTTRGQYVKSKTDGIAAIAITVLWLPMFLMWLYYETKPNGR